MANETNMSDALATVQVAYDLILEGRAAEAFLLMTACVDFDTASAVFAGVAAAQTERAAKIAREEQARERAARINYNYECLVAEGWSPLEAHKRANAWG